MAAKGSSGQSVETLAVARPARTSTTKTATKKTATKKTASATKTAAAATKTAPAVEKTAAKKSAPAAKKTAPAKKSAPAAKKTAPAKKSAPAAKKTAPAKKSAPAAKKTAPAKKAAPAKKSAPAATKTASASKEAPATKAPATKAPAKKAAAKGDASRLAVREGERPWTARETAEVRAALQSDEQRLEEEISAVEEEIGHLLREGGEGAGHDQADVGSNTFERDHEMSMAKNAKDNLVLVREAIARIDDGTYGVCESCGNPIGKMRLQAFPRATLCMECKQRQERR